MEDRRIASHTYSDTFGAGSSASYTGVVYAPKPALTFHGNSSLAAYTTVICDTLSMVGTINFNSNYSSLTGGNPLKVTVLVE